MNSANILAILLTFFVLEIDTYRILSIVPVPFKSHIIFQHALLKNLAKKGHQVDVISYHELSNAPKNYKTIINLSNINHTHPNNKYSTIQESIERNKNILQMIKYDYGLNICNLMANEKIQNLIKKPPKDPPYDIFITQGTTTSCFFGFGSLLKIPVVSVSPSLEFPFFTKIIGNPLCLSFCPTLSNIKSELVTFLDRVENTLMALTKFYRHKSYSENQSEAIKKYLYLNNSSVREVEKLVSLLITNTYSLVQGLRPKVPGLIEAGGLHIEEDDSELTPDLKQWMDESINGVILLSLGSMLPIESLPNDTIRSIFSTFEKISPTRILLKVTEGYKMPLKPPKNVLSLTWIPQIAVLRHNKTRLFITHGGMQSIMEVIYFGIPIIGIPIFFDQQQNVQIVVEKGLGLQLNYDEITENSFYNALMTILNNSKFREAAKYHSKIFRDRPLSAGDETGFWIEYVIKNGANSLRSPAADLYLWQTEQLDIYVFLLLCLIIIVYFLKTFVVTNFKHHFANKFKPQLKTE